MIGRLRAAWDDSRRTAHHRRGTNPMSRTEWLDVVETINSLPTPDSDLDRYLAGIAAQEERSAAEYQEFLRLRRPSADRNDTDAPPFSDAQEARIRELASELVNAVLFGASLQGEDPSFENTDRGSSLTRDEAKSFDWRVRFTENLLRGYDEGRRHYERGVGVVKEPVEVVDQDTSPSADDGGAHSVGEGEVAGVETAAPVTDATDRGGNAGCSAQVRLAGHVIDLTLTQNEYMGAVTMTVHLPEEPIWRTIVHPSLGNGDGHQVLPTYDLPVDEGLGGQGESEGSTPVGTLEGAGGLLGHTPAHASATSREERVSGSGVVHESEHGEGAAGCGHRGADGGEREEAHRVRPQCEGNDDVPVTVGPDVELVGVGNENGLEFGRGGDGPFGHSASPSSDGGHRTVGEGEVAGVETAAPVTDATDVFAGPGLFRFDGSQAHTAAHTAAHAAAHAAANDAATRQAMTRQIGDYLAELHRQGESWHQMARLILHVFELRQKP